MRGLMGQDKKTWLVVSFMLLIAVGVYFVVDYVKQTGLTDNYPDKRVIKYSFTMQNPTNRLIETASFWVYLPIKQTAFQKRGNVNFSHPVENRVGLSGNEKIIFTAKNLPPFGSKVFSISAEMNIANSANRISPVEMESYLRPEKHIESEDPKIIAIAETLKKDSMADTAININNWVMENLSDAGYTKRDHGALYALDKKTGDCTEFMNLFLALARANGIPARGVAGYINKESTILKSRNYHNWAEVYIDSVWRVVDPLNKVIFKNDNHYIAMRYLGPSAKDNADNTQRFFDSDASVRVSMN